jgi:hypothetical protein
MTRKLCVPVVLGVLLAACESPSADDGRTFAPSFMQAALTGAVEVRHDGDAEWGTGGPDFEHQRFFVRSEDEEGSSLRLKILLASYPASIQVGVYPVETRYWQRGDNEGNTATYRRPDGEWFVAESGSFTIVRSEYEPWATEGFVEGHFEFTAVFWCNVWQDRDACLEFPDEFPPDARRIHVTGEFAAGAPPVVQTLGGGS